MFIDIDPGGDIDFRMAFEIVPVAFRALPADRMLVMLEARQGGIATITLQVEVRRHDDIFSMETQAARAAAGNLRQLCEALSAAGR